MNKKSSMVLLVVWIIMLVLMYKYFLTPKMNGNAKNAGNQVTLSADKMLQNAQKATEAAGTDKKELGNAANLYQKVADTYPKTEYAAEALLQKGIVHETKMNDSLHAVEIYTNLQRDYADTQPDIVSRAKVQLASIDEKNSHAATYKIIDFLVGLTGRNSKYSFFLALLIITLVFKLVTTPLSHLQFKYMKEMQKIQPLVKEIQEKYKGDSKVVGEKLMALYKEHGVNPFSSCLPMLVQMPVLFLLYGMVRVYQVQFANGEFLWIGSGLAHMYPTIIAANLALPDIPLLVLYCLSMFVSQKLTIVDPTQAEQQKMMAYFMPIMMAFFFKGFPSAFMLYWLLFNIVSTTQQYMILKPGKDAGPSGTASSGGGKIVPPVIDEPKRLPTNPGKARRGKKRFEAQNLSKPTLNSITSG
ncbi:MAG: membrane protein insertase YidC [Armatimonadota bacterium]